MTDLLVTDIHTFKKKANYIVKYLIAVELAYLLQNGAVVFITYLSSQSVISCISSQSIISYLSSQSVITYLLSQSVISDLSIITIN